MVPSANQGWNELVTKYRKILARLADRARMEQELLKMKGNTETEQHIRMNQLRETQSKILAELEQRLEELSESCN